MARENKQVRHERRFGKPERLIDMCLQNRWKLPYWITDMDDRERTGLVATKDAVIADLRKAKVIVADNVCEFFYTGNDKEYWDVNMDFPCCSPPFSDFFIEMKRPSRICSEGKVLSSAGLVDSWGWLFKFKTREEIKATINDAEFKDRQIETLKRQLSELWSEIDANSIAQAMRSGDVMNEIGKLGVKEQTFAILSMQYRAITREDPMSVFESSMPKEMRWCAELELIISSNGSPCLVANSKIVVSETGKIMGHPVLSLLGGTRLSIQVAKALVDSFNGLSFPAFLALSFMHCKNVTVDDSAPDRRINKEREKAGLKPFVRYHTINIEPMKKVLRTEGQSETEGLKRALHICRGHFSTYSEEKPLFGKVAGTFWIPAHVRGEIKQGVVISDYKVNPAVQIREQERDM